MLIKTGKVNPLNVINARRCEFPSPHFHYTIISNYNTSIHILINEWIYNNLNHRYYVGQALSLIDNSITYVLKIGFEQEKELSFFNIACPYLTK